MTVHEQERLSAWLDGELPPAERAKVEAHLAACEECAARLAELGAVDDIARGLPLAAPPGYFEGFAGRLRARIEGLPGTRSAPLPKRRMPVWSWAAAAALLLAVVTPLTLDRLERDRPRQDSVQPAVRETADLELRPGALGEQDRAAPGDREKGREARTRAEAAPEPALDVTVGEAPPTFAPAPGPTGRDRSVSEDRSPRGRVAAPSFAPVPSEEPVARPGAATLAAPGVPPVRAEGEALEETLSVAAATRPQPKDDGAASEAAPEDAPVPSTAPARSRVAVPRAVERPQVLGSLEKKARDEAAHTYTRLVRSHPSDASGWREQREAWRDFVGDHPQSAHADEARVRVVEAGLAAWRTGGDPEDLARARADGAAYLERDDARQRDRVRGALDQAETP